MADQAYVKSLHEAISALGRPMTYYPSLVRLLGFKETLVLCELLYWGPRGKKSSGWIYKSAEEIEVDTGLGYKDQWRARQGLVKRGLIEQRHDRSEHVMYFRVVPEAVNRLLPGVEVVPADSKESAEDDAEISSQRAPSKLEGAMESSFQNGRCQIPKRKVAPSKLEGGTFQNGRSYKEQVLHREDTSSTQISNNDLSRTKEARENWRKISTKLKPVIGVQAWETWVRPLSGAGVDADTLIVQAPTPEFSQWVREHWTEAILAAAKTLDVKYRGVRLTARRM